MLPLELHINEKLYTKNQLFLSKSLLQSVAILVWQVIPRRGGCCPQAHFYKMRRRGHRPRRSLVLLSIAGRLLPELGIWPPCCSRTGKHPCSAILDRLHSQPATRSVLECWLQAVRYFQILWTLKCQGVLLDLAQRHVLHWSNWQVGESGWLSQWPCMTFFFIKFSERAVFAGACWQVSERLSARTAGSGRSFFTWWVWTVGSP